MISEDAWKEKEKAIRDHVLQSKTEYFNSNTYKVLKKRIENIQDALDLKTKTIGNFRSQLVYPLMREQYNLRRATLNAAYEGDPIVSLEPIGDTSDINARIQQEVLNHSLTQTRFRAKALDMAFHYVSAFGVCPMLTYYHPVKVEEAVTQFDQMLQVSERVIVTDEKQTVRNSSLHPMHYFQDPSEPDPDDAMYKGHIDRIRLSELIAITKGAEGDENTPYDTANLKKITKRAVDQSIEDADYWTYGDLEDRDYEDNLACKSIDRIHYWGELPIDGNEEDHIKYYVQLIGDTIVRFQSFVYDNNIDGYAILKLHNRPEYWWGNSNVEMHQASENYMRILMNVSGDQALQSLDVVRWYPEGMVNISDIQNRHRRGGWVPYQRSMEENLQIQNLVSQMNMNTPNFGSAQYMSNEIKELTQRNSDRPFMGSTGEGLVNKTATAANQLAMMGDILQRDYLRCFNYGLEKVMYHNNVILRQVLPDSFNLRIDKKMNPIEVSKNNILGDFNFNIETSFDVNEQQKFMEKQNAVSWLMNLVGTGHPAFQNVNLIHAVRDALRENSAFRRSVDKILPETPPRPPMTPQMPPQAGVPQGAQPQPQPQPPQAQGVQ